MATADEYAQWIVDNADKKGTDDFNTVVQAYEQAKRDELKPNTETMPAASFAGVQGVMSGARPAAEAAYGLTAGMRDLGNVAKNVASASPQSLKEMFMNPIQTAKAYAMGHPFISQGIGATARNVAGAIAAPIAAPENLFTAPYTMAAYEQQKIRQNPNAPGLEYNPYAQVQRGEAQTQGQAAAANQMRSVANMPYGNVSPQERRILDEDRMMRQNIRKKAYEKVMGPVSPYGALGATSGY